MFCAVYVFRTLPRTHLCNLEKVGEKLEKNWNKVGKVNGTVKPMTRSSRNYKKIQTIKSIAKVKVKVSMFKEMSLGLKTVADVKVLSRNNADGYRALAELEERPELDVIKDIMKAASSRQGLREWAAELKAFYFDDSKAGASNRAPPVTRLTQEACKYILYALRLTVLMCKF